MSTKHRAVASFDGKGKLVSHCQNFRRLVPQSAEALIARAVKSMLKNETEEERWILVGQKRVLLQALHGKQAGCLALVHDAARDQNPTRTGLSPRQLEIAQHAAKGASAPEIARELKISVHTVRQHLKEAYRRLRVGNRVELRNEIEGYGRRVSTMRPKAG